ncbi:MAG: NADH-quinone oxidoreductase subunit C [Legionella sp. 40-6]|nr:NADH-quinone oxidoreductase subunit C [Legionella sp.]OJY14633.1 MAG: NADH-quinone oxidoreductase subunit C [Legionella sp. 40-6]
MIQNDTLVEKLKTELASPCNEISIAYDEVNIECDIANLKTLMMELRDVEAFSFDQLIDLCAVDYLSYGEYDWETDSATEDGFCRGVELNEARAYTYDKPRFAIVYHLLSTIKNHRLRVKVFVGEEHLVVPSVHDIWKGANWFEREAYDLFGVLFEGHPDLRRLLTDYGFIGHPFRKDFPVSGHVEMRYDAKLQKVIYEPVDLAPRVLVPKVIRKDNRYIVEKKGK